MGRPSQYRTPEEHLLNVMMGCVQEDNTIPRYLVRNRIGMWLKAKQLDELLKTMGLTIHYRDDQWRGQYYLAADVSEMLFELRKKLDVIEQDLIRKELETDKASA